MFDVRRASNGVVHVNDDDLAAYPRRVARATDRKLFGTYRYRVYRMSGDRVELQVVRKGAELPELPDLIPVEMWPGVAGVHAELAQGAEVLVQFIAGDRTQPIITHFAGRGGPGFVPASLVIGGPGGQPAARQGDTVAVLLPPAIFTGTINGIPQPPLPVFPAVKLTGIITGGSGKVRSA